jgi:hypothetical protein
VTRSVEVEGLGCHLGEAGILEQVFNFIREAIKHALRCPHEDMLPWPNFAAVITARPAGQPLCEAHQH